MLAYSVAALQISEAWLQKLKHDYTLDSRTSKLIVQIEENDGIGVNAAEMPFEFKKGIIYAKPDEVHLEKRPVIPRSMECEVFEHAHDQLGNQGYHRTYERDSAKFYIFNLSKKLRAYLHHCHRCKISSSPRHRPYGALQPILTPPHIFHAISIEFIMALPRSLPDLFDCALSVTDKLSKAITLIPGTSTWTAAQWGSSLISHLMLVLWGVLRATISDRDRKFISQVLKGIMDSLSIKLLFSTAWPPQIFEIALRYYLAIVVDTSLRHKSLPHLTATLSNSISHGTGVSATMVMYGSRIKEPLGIAADKIFELLDSESLQTSSTSGPEHTEEGYAIETATYQKYKAAMIEAIDAVKLAAMFMKQQYDARHKPLFFEVGDYALIRLHRGCNLPSLTEQTTKIGQQFAGPFKAVERIGRLAYRIELPESMKFHPVISVAHLEPFPDPTQDPFKRPFGKKTLQKPELVPERILQKRQ